MATVTDEKIMAVNDKPFNSALLRKPNAIAKKNKASDHPAKFVLSVNHNITAATAHNAANEKKTTDLFCIRILFCSLVKK